MTEQEMKIIHERLRKEDPKLLSVMEKCFDAGVLSGKEQAQRTWVGLTDEESVELMRQVPHLTIGDLLSVEAKLKEKNT